MNFRVGLGYVSPIYIEKSSFVFLCSFPVLLTCILFTAAERCLNITYIMDTKTNVNYPGWDTKFDVTVFDGTSVLQAHTFINHTDTTWKYVLIDLPAVNDLKVGNVCCGHHFLLVWRYILWSCYSLFKCLCIVIRTSL